MAFNKKTREPGFDKKAIYPQFPVKELNCAICGARKVSPSRILFTFKGDGFLIMNMALVSTNDGSTFISGPYKMYTNKKGEQQYSKVAMLFFSPEDTKKITETVLEFYEENQKDADFKTSHYIYYEDIPD